MSVADTIAVQWLHPHLEGDHDQWLGTLIGVEGIKIGLKWPLPGDNSGPVWWLEARTDPNDPNKWTVVDEGAADCDLGKAITNAEARLIKMFSEVMGMVAKKGGSA